MARLRPPPPWLLAAALLAAGGCTTPSAHGPSVPGTPAERPASASTAASGPEGAAAGRPLPPLPGGDLDALPARARAELAAVLSEADLTHAVADELEWQSNRGAWAAD